MRVVWRRSRERRDDDDYERRDEQDTREIEVLDERGLRRRTPDRVCGELRHAENKAEPESPACAAQVHALPEKSRQEHRDDRRREERLHRLDVLVEPAARDRLHDREPQKSERRHDDGRGAPDYDELLLRSLGLELLVDIDGEERRDGIEERRERAHERRDHACDYEPAETNWEKRLHERREHGVAVQHAALLERNRKRRAVDYDVVVVERKAEHAGNEE